MNCTETILNGFSQMHAAPHIMASAKWIQATGLHTCSKSENMTLNIPQLSTALQFRPQAGFALASAFDSA